MKRRDLFGLMAATAAAPHSALDVAGQMKALPMEAGPEGFVRRRVAEGLRFRVGGLAKGVLFYGPWEMRIHPGADARFTLYEDDGETYRYERGERATTAPRWDDARRTLHIDARQGRHPGLVARRTLNVRRMAVPGQAEQTRTVAYPGQAAELHFAASTR
jgi:hypothetical protein